MKIVLILAVMTLAMGVQAETLVNCKLYSNGKIVSEVDSFNIDHYSTNEPEADIDGGLLSYDKDEQTVAMSFSNECDNMYEISFSTKAIEMALSGKYKILIGKATIGTADLEVPFTGILKCSVRN